MEVLVKVVSLLLAISSAGCNKNDGHKITPDVVSTFRDDNDWVYQPIVFPDQVTTEKPKQEQVTTEEPEQELPEDLDMLDPSTLSRLNSITDITQFAAMFNLKLPEPETPRNVTPVLRLGDNVIEDTGEEQASMANCKPELRTVELDLPNDPQTNYFPTCVRIEQCGGCCFGPLLTCRPTVTKSVKLKVLKSPIVLRTSGRGRRRNRRRSTPSYHTVSVVKHTACECGCEVQESDCNLTIHNYREGECKCVCKDRDEKAKCEEQNGRKYWDDKSCTCNCSLQENEKNCGSGEFFNESTCMCEHVTTRSGGLSGTGARVGFTHKPRRNMKPQRVY